MTGKELFETFKSIEPEEQSIFLEKMVDYSKIIGKNVSELQELYGENLEHLKEKNPAGFNKDWVKEKIFGL